MTTTIILQDLKLNSTEMKITMTTKIILGDVKLNSMKKKNNNDNKDHPSKCKTEFSEEKEQQQ